MLCPLEELELGTPATYKGVIAELRKKPQEIQDYFWDYEGILRDYSWDVSVSYVFSRIEGVKHWTIYCGIVKLHWTNSELTKGLVDKDHMSRGRFRILLKTVFGEPIPEPILQKLSSAEAVRDRYAHGKIFPPSAAQTRQAMVDIFEFAEEFNAYVFGLAGFRPFGNLQGFKGRAESLSKETTKWVLLGMGIPAKAPVE